MLQILQMYNVVCNINNYASLLNDSSYCLLIISIIMAINWKYNANEIIIFVFKWQIA